MTCGFRCNIDVRQLRCSFWWLPDQRESLGGQSSQGTRCAALLPSWRYPCSRLPPWHPISAAQLGRRYVLLALLRTLRSFGGLGLMTAAVLLSWLPHSHVPTDTRMHVNIRRVSMGALSNYGTANFGISCHYTDTVLNVNFMQLLQHVLLRISRLIWASGNPSLTQFTGLSVALSKRCTVDEVGRDPGRSLTIYNV